MRQFGHWHPAYPDNIQVLPGALLGDVVNIDSIAIVAN